jgi:hypothetical protein
LPQEIQKKGFSLDGELFLGYNEWNAIQRITFDNSLWKNVKFMIFYLIPPPTLITKLTFEERIKSLKEVVSENELIQIVEHQKCDGAVQKV